MPLTRFTTNEVLEKVLDLTDPLKPKLRTDASLDVSQLNVENLNLEVHVEANPDAGEDADSLIIAGTTDGAFPPTGPNTTTRPIRVDVDGHTQTDILTSALPAGASTETTLSALNTKISTQAESIHVIYGPATTPTTTAVAVGTIATQLVAANASRRGLLIFNNGTADIFIGGVSVATATGIPLPVGASILVDVPARYTGSLFAIASAAQVSPSDTRILELT